MGERYSVAIRYDTSMPAPFVVAAGRDHLAQRLLDIARKAGVPVHRDAELAERLLWLQPGEVIPEELYRPVAEVLTFVLDVDRLISGRSGGAVSDTMDRVKKEDEKNPD
jgi:flagellar biosynthesis protein